MCPILGLNSLCVFVLLFFSARDLSRSLFSKSPAYNSYKHASLCLALSSSRYLNNKLRSRMELEPKNSAKSVIERAVMRGLTADRSKINPQVVRRKLRPKSEASTCSMAFVSQDRTRYLYRDLTLLWTQAPQACGSTTAILL